MDFKLALTALFGEPPEDKGGFTPRIKCHTLGLPSFPLHRKPTHQDILRAVSIFEGDMMEIKTNKTAADPSCEVARA